LAVRTYVSFSRGFHGNFSYSGLGPIWYTLHRNASKSKLPATAVSASAHPYTAVEETPTGFPAAPPNPNLT